MAEAQVDSRRIAVDLNRGHRTQPTDLHYLVTGSGPPIVLLHGIGIDAAGVSWRHVIPKLAVSHRVYALDLPGHGQSDKPRVAYTTEYFRAALSAFLDAKQLHGATVAGISMGGAIALDYAITRDPKRLILVDSYGLGGETYWRAMAGTALWTPGLGSTLWAGLGSSRKAVRESLQTLVGNGETPPADFIDDVADAVGDGDSLRTLRSWQRSEFKPDGLRTDFSGELHTLDTPTLLIHGERDPLLPTRWSRNAHDQLPESELEIVTDCGHWPPRERPAIVTHALESFLQK